MASTDVNLRRLRLVGWCVVEDVLDAALDAALAARFRDAVIDLARRTREQWIQHRQRPG